MSLSLPKLDPREEHFCIASCIEGLTLFLRYMPPNAHQTDTPKIVLYVHGGSFPSALSIAHRFDGRSWRDELADAGFHVWGLDFHGFGASDPYPEMAEPAECNPVLGRAEGASQQIERAVRFICDHHGVSEISIIGHSWGTIAVGRFAGRCPDLVDRLVFFGPVTWRQKEAEPQTFAAWRLVSLKDQWDRFTAEVPSEEPAVLSKRHLRNGDLCTWTRTGRAGLAYRRVSRRRAGLGRTSLPPAPATSLTILASSARLSRSSVANGTASLPMPMLAGSSMR
jgi:pimeloyl-ACP methyl ester carboxylesterase